MAHRWKHEKSASQRGYGAPWRRKRAAVLMRDNHLCQVCMAQGRITAATEVDHKVPKYLGGKDEATNLWAICHPCHQEKTQEEAKAAAEGKGGWGRIGEDGWPIEL